MAITRSIAVPAARKGPDGIAEPLDTTEGNTLEFRIWSPAANIRRPNYQRLEAGRAVAEEARAWSPVFPPSTIS